MSQLCSLHSKTNIDASGEYLSPETDRQVGLGILGLANFLSLHGVSYKEFGDALEAINDGHSPVEYNGAYALANALDDAVKQAAQVARFNKMDRAFAIAPTASCSYRYTDRNGYTTCPELAPPIARQVDRDSGTFGVESFDYGPV